jgi:hypothetical protein
MALLLALLVFLFAGFSTGSTATGWSPAPQAKGARPASLRITSTAPLTVKGRSFAPGERVRLTFAAGGKNAHRTVTTRTGSFQVGARIHVDRCSGAFVVAAGNRGSHATASLPLPACAPE